MHAEREREGEREGGKEHIFYALIVLSCFIYIERKTESEKKHIFRTINFILLCMQREREREREGGRKRAHILCSNSSILFYIYREKNRE